MAGDFKEAIAALEARLADAERKANGLRLAINALCEENGEDPRYPDGGGAPLNHHSSKDAGSGGGVTLAQIRSDSFTGKKLQTAVREYLDMRAATAGMERTAKPRDMLDALKRGGFEFATRDDEVSLQVIRSMLRKRTAFFRKVGATGAYGLAAWYPERAKAPPAKGANGSANDADGDLSDDGADDDAGEASAKRPHKHRAAG